MEIKNNDVSGNFVVYQKQPYLDGLQIDYSGVLDLQSKFIGNGLIPTKQSIAISVIREFLDYVISCTELPLDDYSNAKLNAAIAAVNSLESSYFA